jgi:hypothetical protein
VLKVYAKEERSQFQRVPMMSSAISVKPNLADVSPLFHSKTATGPGLETLWYFLNKRRRTNSTYLAILRRKEARKKGRKT